MVQPCEEDGRLSFSSKILRIRYTKTVCYLASSKNVYTTSDEQQYMTYDTMSLLMKQTLS